MEITLVQLDSVWEDATASFRKVEKLLAAVPPSPGGMVVLPEMFATGFSLDLEKTASAATAETESFLQSVAATHRVTVVAGSVRCKADGIGRNEAIVYSPAGKLLARYVKQRPFSGAREELVHERGFNGANFVWGGLKVAPLICYDLRFPELFRGGAKAGAEVFVVIAAWPSKRIEHWVTLLRARAIENQAYVVGVNRTGQEPQSHYCGRSLLIDPHGTVILDAGEEECVTRATIDPKLPGAWREEFPAYRDFLRWS